MKVSTIFKHLLYLLILALLLLPAVQGRLGIVEMKDLYGGFITEEKPSLKSLNDSTWFSSHFQAQFTRAVQEHCGFRSFFVRLNNQVNFSTYGITENPNLVIGKENCLFEEGYILAYRGRNFIGNISYHGKI